MKPWEVWTWRFPDAGEHPAVVPGTEERLNLKPRVCVILCSTQRATRRPELHEVILNEADGLDAAAAPGIAAAEQSILPQVKHVARSAPAQAGALAAGDWVALK